MIVASLETVQGCEKRKEEVGDQTVPSLLVAGSTAGGVTPSLEAAQALLTSRGSQGLVPPALKFHAYFCGI